MYRKLLTEISKMGLTINDFAEFVKITPEVFSLKIQKKREFSYKDIIRIVEFFNCKLSADYLFSEI